jgi:hypothetical protein
MQALKTQLEALTQTLGSLTQTDVSAMEDAKSLKSLAFVVDRVLDMLANETCTLEQLKLRTLKKLETKISTVRPHLEAAEKKFMTRYASVPRPITTPQQKIGVDFAGLKYACPLYDDQQQVPVLGYGAVMIRSQPVLVYRYSPTDFVSVSPCIVADYASDNAHTICCGNGVTCEYGQQCRYYHDPVEWPESTHVQRFQKSALVKRCPSFGHAPALAEQAVQLSFEHLRTLARYCAVQTLMIHLVASRA